MRSGLVTGVHSDIEAAQGVASDTGVPYDSADTRHRNRLAGGNVYNLCNTDIHCTLPLPRLAP